MNIYIHLYNGIITEFIPEESKDFPGVPIEERYSKDFLDNCIIKTEEYVEEHKLHIGMLYDADTDSFAEPPIPEEPDVPEIPTEEGFTVTEEEINNAYEEGVNNVE